MTCDEIMRMIEAAQAEFEELHELPEGLTEWPLVTIVCRAFSYVVPVKGASLASSFNDLADMCVMLDLMRRGEDPRCATCIAKEKLNDYFSSRFHHMRNRENVQ